MFCNESLDSMQCLSRPSESSLRSVFASPNGYLSHSVCLSHKLNLC